MNAFSQNAQNGKIIGTVDAFKTMVKNVSNHHLKSDKNTNFDNIFLPISPNDSIQILVNRLAAPNEGHALVGESTDRNKMKCFISISSEDVVYGYLYYPKTGFGYVYRSAGDIVLVEDHSQHNIIGFIQSEESVFEETEIKLAKNRKPKLESKTLDTSPSWDKLESLPGAEAVIYLDFDGEYVEISNWVGLWDDPIDAEPRKLPDGSGWSDDKIKEIWQAISEDFLPFTVNITTNRALFDAAPVNRKTHCIFSETNEWYDIPSAGGVAHVNSFSNNGAAFKICWVFWSSSKRAWEAASHEIGHSLGLDHHGQSPGDGEYFRGHAEWGTIMGLSTSRDVSQWCKGEFENADKTQDDLALITKKANGITYRNDDHSDIPASATPLLLEPDGSILVSSNYGIISQNTDLDLFSFTTTGEVNITASTSTISPNLNIKMILKDEAGNSLYTSDDLSTLNATIHEIVPPGKYYLEIDGTGELDPLTTGYSDYGSLGEFGLSGHIEIPLNTSPTLGPDQSICGLNNLTLNSHITPLGERTFEWFKDEVQLYPPSYSLSTIEISTPGDYRVVLDSAGIFSTSDRITISGELDNFSFGGPFELCTPSFVDLTIPISGTEIEYQWYQDGTLLTSTEDQLHITTPGSYEGIASVFNCPSVSSVITVSSRLPLGFNDTICGPGTVFLEIEDLGGTYEWFTSPIDDAAINSGTSYSPALVETSTYYVEDASSFEQSVGPDLNTLTSAQNSGIVGIKLKTYIAIDLLSIDGFPFVYSCNSGDQVTLNIELVDNANQVITTTSASIDCKGLQGQFDTPFDTYSFVFDSPLSIPAAGDYTLRPGAGSSQFIWFANGANFGASDMSIPGILDITSDTRTDASTSFPAFSNLVVSSGGTSCDRTEVQGRVLITGEEGCVITNTNSINDASKRLNVFPSKSNKREFNIHVNGLLTNENLHLSAYNYLGQNFLMEEIDGYSQIIINVPNNLATQDFFFVRVYSNTFHETVKVILQP